MEHFPNLDDYECKWYNFNGVQFPYWDQLPLKIAVKMSGGIDSSTIMYILAYLKKNKLLHNKSTLHAFTAQNWNRPYQVEFINKSLQLIKNKLNIDIKLDHWIEGDPYGWNDMISLEDAQSEVMQYAYDECKIHMYYTGRSKFLPIDFIDNTEYENTISNGCFGPPIKYKTMLNLHDPQNNRYNHDTDMQSRAWENTAIEKIHQGSTVHPWINLNKSHVKVCSDYLGVTDELLANTRSCEYFEYEDKQYLDFKEHCGDCYWCVERQVTYGKLNG